VDRHALGVSKLPEGLFLASNIGFAAFVFTWGVPGWFPVVGLINAVLLFLAVSKACDAVNALSEGFSIVRPGPPARTMLLRCVLGEFQGDDLELENGEVIIGRNPAQANLVFSSDEVSGRHVRLWRDAGTSGVWVEDMNSTNGTYYRESVGPNGGWIRLSGRKLLPAGSHFRLGQDLAEFEVKPA
jgi:hypothetical protein